MDGIEFLPSRWACPSRERGGHGKLGHIAAGAADGLDVGGVHRVRFTGMKRMNGMDGIEFLPSRWAFPSRERGGHGGRGISPLAPPTDWM